MCTMRHGVRQRLTLHWEVSPLTIIRHRVASTAYPPNNRWRPRNVLIHGYLTSIHYPTDPVRGSEGSPQQPQLLCDDRGVLRQALPILLQHPFTRVSSDGGKRLRSGGGVRGVRRVVHYQPRRRPHRNRHVDRGAPCSSREGRRWRAPDRSSILASGGRRMLGGRARAAAWRPTDTRPGGGGRGKSC